MSTKRIFAALAAAVLTAGVLATMPAGAAGFKGSIAITSPLSGGYLGAEGVITWAYETGTEIADDSVVRAGVKSDGPDYTEVGSAPASDGQIAFDATALPAGAYNVRLTVDGSNKQSVVDGVLLDAIAPTITINVEPAACDGLWCNADEATVVVTASDAESGLATDPSGTYAVSDEGVNDLSFTAVDNAGNAATASVAISMDRTAPSIELSLAPAACGAPSWCNDAAAAITVTASDALSGLADDPSGEYEVTDEGITTRSFTATDLAGNSATVEITVQIDRTGPVTLIDPIDPPVLLTPLGGVVTGSATDNLSGVASTTVTFTNVLLEEVAVVDADCIACGTVDAEWSASTAGLTPGLYSVTASSVDVAGNQGAESAPLQILII